MPEGPEGQPWLQHINAEFVDTSEFTSPGAKKACFANASISNPWRQTGWITMNQQLQVLQEQGAISEMETRDAQDSDDTQIADIDYFIDEGNCDVFIISPNSTAALTPAVERACETGKPVIVFDRGVETDCPTTFIHPIGGFAWGIDTAEFLIDELEEGDKVVALRILPGVDVLEQRWAAAEKLFDEAGIDAVDYFTGADPAEIKKIISDELAKGDVQGVWMDAGDGAVAAIEAFEDAGADYPVMTGEDEMSFLRKWKETGLTGLAPVYSNFQWRTPLLAAQMIFAGQEVPKEWVLPQLPITGRGGRPVPRGQRRHARRPLREVRRRRPAGLPGGLAGAGHSVTGVRRRRASVAHPPVESWSAASRPPCRDPPAVSSAPGLDTRLRRYSTGDHFCKEAACAARSA